MRDGVRVLTLSHIVFIAMLSLSGGVSGIVGDVIYYLAFVLPLVIGFYGARRLKAAREELSGVAEVQSNFFSLNGKALVGFLPLVMPVVTLVLFVSWLTAGFMGLFGLESPQVENVGFWKMLLIHALVPSVTEELVFRFLPLVLLLPYSPRYCIIISSLFFSLCHCDVFKLPYAFIAGVAMMFVDIISDSVLPSVILHFVNNAVSVGWIVLPVRYRLAFVLALVAVSAVSLFFIFLRRKNYREAIKALWQRGEGFAGGREASLLVILAVFISVTNLFLR